MSDFLFIESFMWHIPDSQVHGANMGPTWVLSAPDGLHVGPMNPAIRDRHENSWVFVRNPNLAITVPTDAPRHNGAKPSAGAVMTTKLSFKIYADVPRDVAILWGVNTRKCA